MKLSKFIKDLFATGLTQILVLLLGLILLRIMATALSKEYFGIFMVIRRAVGIGVPLITLNFGVGLARYVSYEREKEREFLNASLWVIGIISLLVIITSIIFRDQLSLIFFTTSNYSLFVVLTAFILFSYGIYTISYAFFRGRQEMNSANKMQVLYYLFPVIVSLILWQLFTNQYSKILSSYLFFFSLWGIALGTIYMRDIRQKVHLGLLPAIIKDIKSVKAFFFYSLSRIPSGFFLALVFGIPVFVASHKISLVAAGYVGIAVAIVRLMEIFATPFNLLFLPKFAEIKRNNVSGEISNKVLIVTSFIFTALPLVAVLSYGLAEYAVIIFFGTKYIPATQGVSLVILFSVFYVSYVLVRGILDGIFSFPYVNIICLTGLLTTAISSFLFHGNVLMLALDFGLGFLVMGVGAVCILIKKANIPVQLNEMLVSLIVALLIFVLLIFLDRLVELAVFNEYVRFGAKILYRVILFLAVFWFYWKPKSLWVRELLYRTRI
jgi:O-antigen/teichoic acid export membrane protein